MGFEGLACSHENLLQNLAWLAWPHKFFAWVGWVYKVGLRPNFGMGLKNALCQSKME